MARQQFTAEVKREAVRLLERGDKPTTQLSAELDVPRNRLYKWRDALHTHGEQAFPGQVGRSLRKEGSEWTFLRKCTLIPTLV
ncbi:transposase [Lysobacter capsici]|uniref:transposase n=1 Tax=Lysobacter capsici TaxID=435897 RepID=UPI0009EAA968